MKLTKKAFAKINLTLEILGKRRGDGFHDIASVMMKTPELYDEVSIEVYPETETAGKVNFFCDKNVCEPEKNLACRVAKLYFDAAQKETGKKLPSILVALQKHIPSGAGLAGGSADAAAGLNGFDEVFGVLSRKELFEIALSLGSDIPFCLADCDAALCTGRGEILNPLPKPEHVRAEIRFPKTPLSTSGIYAEYDRFHGDDYTKNRSFAMAEALKRKAKLEEFAFLMCNDFQELCEKRCPEITELCEKLKSEGAYAQMSGSGSAVFGLWNEN